jgi:hypothetical protein
MLKENPRNVSFPFNITREAVCVNVAREFKHGIIIFSGENHGTLEKKYLN